MDFSSPDVGHLIVKPEASDGEQVVTAAVRALGYACANPDRDIKIESGVIEITLANDICPGRAIDLVQSALHSPDIGQDVPSLSAETEIPAAIDVYDDGLPFVFGSHQLT